MEDIHKRLEEIKRVNSLIDRDVYEGIRLRILKEILPFVEKGAVVRGNYAFYMKDGRLMREEKEPETTILAYATMTDYGYYNPRCVSYENDLLDALELISSPE